MHFALILIGLPGPGYHGGAMTCWAILKQMLDRGHRSTVISLFDVSSGNQYLESREEQTRQIEALGADVIFVEYDHRALVRRKGSSLESKVNILLGRDMESVFPWSALRDRTDSVLKSVRPDAAFIYHADALSAVYESGVPKMAGMSDLWHMPLFFQWRNSPASLRKYLLNYPNFLFYKRNSTHHVLSMLAKCQAFCSFSGQYVPWYERCGIEGMRYAHTPVFDPLGPGAAGIKSERESREPRILMISANVAGTSTASGFGPLIRDVVPALDRVFGRDGYSLHILGKGKPGGHFHEMDSHPAIRLRGRIVPPDAEFLSANILLVPNSITLGVRVRVITALSFATCVVAHESNAVGIPELRHGQNALLAADGPALAKEAIRALSDEPLRRRLAMEGRLAYERHFKDDVAAGSIVKELEGLVRR